MDLTNLGVGIASGIGLGSVYALIATSFTLIIASTGYFVFALESVVSLGGIIASVLTVDQHVPLLAAVFIVCVCGAVLGIGLELVCHRPFVTRLQNAGPAVLLSSVGVAIALDAASAEIFGNNPRQIAPFLSPQPIFIGSVPVDRTYIVLAVTAGILAAILEIVFRSTTFGRNLRATQGDAEGVALLGLNVKAVITGVFAISGLIAGLSGLLIAPIAFASPSVGTSLVLPAFAAIAIGGFGSFRGGIIGGLLVGLLNGVLPLYISPSAVDLLLFVVIVATLLVRPSGLFATSTSREL